MSKKEPRANYLLPIESAESAGDQMHVGTTEDSDGLDPVADPPAARDK